MKEPVLEVVGLSASFGDELGLRDIGFALNAGERLVLLGASGAGKTTLLRAIAGLGPIAAGRLRIRGRDVTGRPAETRDAVYLHQTALLFPHLSVFENVAFPLRIRGRRDAEVRASCTELLESVRLDGLAARRPHTLSGGEKHRAALARAMAARPAVLLLDEPLSALDPSLRDEVRATLLSLQARYQPAMVIATHDLEDAAVLGDRIGILLGGTLAQLDHPGRLFQRPATLAVARFLGVPNLVAGSVADGTFCSPLGPIPAPPGLSSGPATAAFASDALRPDPCGSLQGVVREVRHGPRGATLRVDVAGLDLEAIGGEVPNAGDAVSLELQRERVTILPGTVGDV